MDKKFIVLILDGLGDRAHEILDNRTPLQAAHTPNLDKLAALGCNGLFHAGMQGVPYPSENAHFSIFGYKDEEFPGRGILEAIGAGIEVGPRDVSVLAHFVSVIEDKDRLVLLKDRPRIDQSELDALLGVIGPLSFEGIKLEFHQTKNLDGVITLSGDVSPYFTDSDPLMEGKEIIGIEPLDSARMDPAASRSAKALTMYLRKSYMSLKDHAINKNRMKAGRHPLNFLATHRPGMSRDVDSFYVRWGLRGLSISSGIIYWGLCGFLGMDVIRFGKEKDPELDITEKIRTAISHLYYYDFIHVHTKGPDTASHAKDPLLKKQVIESIDRGIGRCLKDLLRDELVVAITSDHSTPSSGPMIHSGEPVPITFVGKNVRRDHVKSFDEIQGAFGGLGFVRGNEFMHIVLNYMDRAKLKGLMDTHTDQTYWPGKRKFFKLGQDHHA